MFGTDNKGAAETFIGPSVHVEGNFNSQGNIQVEGSVTGTIKTSANLAVGEQATINANIEAASAYVAGKIKGNLIIHDRLELSATSVVDGDISTKILVMADGAKLNGHCQMNGDLSSLPTPTKTSKRAVAVAPTLSV